MRRVSYWNGHTLEDAVVIERNGNLVYIETADGDRKWVANFELQPR